MAKFPYILIGEGIPTMIKDRWEELAYRRNYKKASTGHPGWRIMEAVFASRQARWASRWGKEGLNPRSACNKCAERIGCYPDPEDSNMDGRRCFKRR